MKPLILLALCAAALPAQATFPFERLYYGTCPYTMIAGSTTMCGMRPLLAFNATVNPATDVFTVTGGTSVYAPVNGDILTAESSGTMPAGMDTESDTVYPNWDVCSVSGATFILREDPGNYSVPGPCTGPQLNVTTAGTGTLTLSLFQFSTKTIYMNGDPTGFPMGTTFSICVPLANRECNHAAPISANGHPYSPDESDFVYRINIPSNATPGTGTAVWHMCSDDSVNCATGTVGTYSWDYNIVAPPSIPYTPPSSFTPMPGLNSSCLVICWETKMTNRPCPLMNCNFAGPANYCDPLANPTAGQLAPSNFTIGFYGWGVFWYYITQYTGTSVYVTGCGKQSSDLTRDYINSAMPPGSMQQCCHFTESMYLAERAFGGGTYQSAGDEMINNTYTLYGPTVEWPLYRENVMSLKDSIALSYLGHTTNPKMQDILDTLISQTLQATETFGVTARIQQQFFLGLAADALEQYFIDVSPDARIPYVIKRIADTLWTVYFDPVNHITKNMPAANGSYFCSDSVPPPWYIPAPTQTGNCNTYPPNYQHLQMMTAPLFYFYYAWTGDTTYRDRGDDFFQHAWDNDNPDGKSESEDYFLSFQGVAWRTGSLTAKQYYGDAPNATVSSTSITGNVTISGKVILQ